jgi:hypothetical protein
MFVSTQLIDNLAVNNFSVVTSFLTNQITEYTPGAGVTIASKLKVTGDLEVDGQLTNISSLDMLVRDPFIYLNTGIALSAGLVMGSSPFGLIDTATQSVGLVVSTIGLATFASGDIINIVGRGIYEVDTHIGNFLTLRGTGGTATVLEFSTLTLESIPAGSSLQIQKIYASALRQTGGIFAIGYGATTGSFTYSNIIPGPQTLQNIYNNSAPPTILLTQPISLKDQVVPIGTLFEITNNAGLPYFEVLNTGTIVNGDLTVTGLIDPPGLQLTPTALNPGNANTIWHPTGGSIQYGTSTLIKITPPVGNNGVLTFNGTDGYNVNSSAVTITGTSITGSSSITLNTITPYVPGTINISGVGILNTSMTVDTINEATLNAINGILLKTNIVTANGVVTDSVTEKTLANGVTIQGLSVRNGNIYLQPGKFIDYDGIPVNVTSGAGILSFTSNVGSEAMPISYSYRKSGTQVFLRLAETTHLNVGTFQSWVTLISDLPLSIRPSSPTWVHLQGRQISAGNGNPYLAGGYGMYINAATIELFPQGDTRGILDGDYPAGDLMGVFRQTLTYDV